MQKTKEQKSAAVHHKIKISDGRDPGVLRKQGIIVDIRKTELAADEANGEAPVTAGGANGEAPVAKVIDEPVAAVQTTENHATKNLGKQVAQKTTNLAQKFTQKKRVRKYPPVHFGAKRILLALACTALVVFVIVVVVDKTTLDISATVRSLDTEVNAVYTEYVPRGYSLSDIISESDRVVLNFRNDELNAAYTIVEQKAVFAGSMSMDAYVKNYYSDDYTKYSDRGMDVYIASRGAVWLSGDVVFELTITSGSLTRKQIMTIATTK